MLFRTSLAAATALFALASTSEAAPPPELFNAKDELPAHYESPEMGYLRLQYYDPSPVLPSSSKPGDSALHAAISEEIATKLKEYHEEADGYKLKEFRRRLTEDDWADTTDSREYEKLSEMFSGVPKHPVALQRERSRRSSDRNGDLSKLPAPTSSSMEHFFSKAGKDLVERYKTAWVAHRIRRILYVFDRVVDEQVIEPLQRIKTWSDGGWFSNGGFASTKPEARHAILVEIRRIAERLSASGKISDSGMPSAAYFSGPWAKPSSIGFMKTHRQAINEGLYYRVQKADSVASYPRDILLSIVKAIRLYLEVNPPQKNTPLADFKAALTNIIPMYENISQRFRATDMYCDDAYYIVAHENYFLKMLGDEPESPF